MTTMPVSQCANFLDFRPLKPWPETMPVFARETAKGVVRLCGFNRVSGEAVVLTASLNELLSDIYGELSLPELARLLPLLQDSEAIDEILKRHGLSGQPDALELLELLRQTPDSFQDWVSQKKPGLRDLQVLKLQRHLKDPETWNSLLIQITLSGASKVIGFQMIEWAVELISMGVPAKAVLENSQASEIWYKTLHKLRFPQTTAKDTEREQRIKHLAWPSHTQVRWVRQGDQAGVEVRFQLYSEHDLDQKIKGLMNVKEGLREKIWTFS